MASKFEKDFKDCESSLDFSPFSMIKEESSKFNFPMDAAKSAKNKNLNRYRDVNPFDYSRIVLQRGTCDYINANLVQVEKAHRKYILTQGPLPNTVSHFWAMVWEQNSKAIVMLNKLIEKNQIKCHLYWPSSKEEVLDFPDVSLRVTLESEVAYQYYTVRNFKLMDSESDESREILHFHYMTWPDFGVPKSPREFLRFLRAVRKSGSLDENVGAPIVHCSAGIGRSGTFCLVDSCLVMIAENGEDSVDVCEVLLSMRKYRMGLVQTVQQLRFSYLSIIEGMKSSWLHNLDDSLDVEDEKLLESLSDSDQEAPPLPPPRLESLPAKRPAPLPPKESPKSKENIDDEDPVRQRKIAKADKQRQLAEKVEEMKRKQDDAEYWDRIKRSKK